MTDIDITSLRARWDTETFFEANADLAEGRPLPKQIHDLLRAVNGYEVMQLPSGENVIILNRQVGVAAKAGWVHLTEDGSGIKVWALTEVGETALRDSRAAVIARATQTRSVWQEIRADWNEVWPILRASPWTTAANLLGAVALIAAVLYGVSLLDGGSR